MHESCHAMGLVPTASADENGHNKCDYGEHYMDRGDTKTLPMRLGFDLWHIQRWKQENADYLRFVFPNFMQGERYLVCAFTNNWWANMSRGDTDFERLSNYLSVTGAVPTGMTNRETPVLQTTGATCHHPSQPIC